MSNVERIGLIIDLKVIENYLKQMHLCLQEDSYDAGAALVWASKIEAKTHRTIQKLDDIYNSGDAG